MEKPWGRAVLELEDVMTRNGLLNVLKDEESRMSVFWRKCY
jgi:hypothetical protein